ncbi:MAG: peptide-methionine (S)-S-oxide reductase MsrA [Gammaproteobacteria bacterium]
MTALLSRLTLLLLLGLALPVHGAAGKMAVATFAGGCFWCMEPPFDALDGVISTTSGYTGGNKRDPSYEDVSGGTTGHAEAVQLVYDPNKVSYEKLLDVFWHSVDPTRNDGQFCDQGFQYRPAIFYHNEQQRRLADQSKKKIEATKTFPETVVTPVVPATAFYPAEAYHQDYYRKNPLRYKFYRSGCGRDKGLRELWGDMQP